MRAAAASRTRPDGTVETGQAAISELVRYAHECGQSTDDAREGIRLGLPAGTPKEYGPRIVPSEIRTLQLGAVPAKTAQSLRGKGGHQLEADDIVRMYTHGNTNGADYATWRGLRATPGQPHTYHSRSNPVVPDGLVLRLAAAGVPASTAANLHAQGAPLDAVRALHDASVNDLTGWNGAAYPRTQTTLSQLNAANQLTAYRAIAAFAAAGGTTEQMRRAQRAGVPLTEMDAHLRSTPEELWAAWAANRAAWIDAEHRFARTWGEPGQQVPPWDVTGPQDL